MNIVQDKTPVRTSAVFSPKVRGRGRCENHNPSTIPHNATICRIGRLTFAAPAVGVAVMRCRRCVPIWKCFLSGCARAWQRSSRFVPPFYLQQTDHNLGLAASSGDRCNRPASDRSHSAKPFRAPGGKHYVRFQPSRGPRAFHSSNFTKWCVNRS
jgi:hypothetical protein